MFDFEETISNCHRCILRQGCTRVVVGNGNKESEIVFLGEAPGAEEDAQGIAFIGKSGKLLRNTLQQHGMKLEDFYITNVIKCRPPNNRTPNKKEIANCGFNTELILSSINPYLIIAVGATAAEYLLGTKITGSQVNNKTFIKSGRYIYCIRHPAYILRSRTESNLAEFDNSIAKIPLLLIKAKSKQGVHK